MKIFNTEFEVSMRLLLLLANSKESLDEEKILYLDFITINAKNYNLASENLNGDGLYMLNELTTQHSLIKESLKALVLEDFISVISTESGFFYNINANGIKHCDSMTSDYSRQYKTNAITVYSKIGSWSINKIKEFAKRMEELHNGIY